MSGKPIQGRGDRAFPRGDTERIARDAELGREAQSEPHACDFDPKSATLVIFWQKPYAIVAV